MFLHGRVRVYGESESVSTLSIQCNTPALVHEVVAVTGDPSCYDTVRFFVLRQKLSGSLEGRVSKVLPIHGRLKITAT